MFNIAKRVAKDCLGMELTEGGSGGFSDANLASMHAPTIDGLGARGEGAHARHEHLTISKMPVRSALLAHLLAELSTI